MSLYAAVSVSWLPWNLESSKIAVDGLNIPPERHARLTSFYGLYATLPPSTLEPIPRLTIHASLDITHTITPTRRNNFTMASSATSTSSSTTCCSTTKSSDDISMPFIAISSRHHFRSSVSSGSPLSMTA